SLTPATPATPAALVHYPRHRAQATPRRPARNAPEPLYFVLLITAPAVIAVAALRPR
ncbi:hypothetical protein GTU99_27390, partial [Streptomyces sp. PRKS01-65]|nr:hypothetical protein [Streptomyces harenosi]